MSPQPNPPPGPPPHSPPPASLEPVDLLLRRIRNELGVFGAGGAKIRVSRAPGRIDVMGGIADYTGSLVCEGTLDRACAVAIAHRSDRQLQVFSFNLLDAHQTFTLRMPLDALAKTGIEDLRRELSEPGRKWAGYILGCLAILQQAGLVDWSDPSHLGMDIALYSTVPLGAGVSSSAAIEVATMINLRDELNLALDPMSLSELCQRVENQVVGAPCGIMDQVTSCAGRAGALLKLKCQPHDLQGLLTLPQGIRVVGINSNVKHSVGGGQYGKTRTAAFMGHRMILSKMADMGKAAGRDLVADPMNGYLANLDLDDYKKYFRPSLPESMSGQDFITRFGTTIDKATHVDPAIQYHVQSATDHHVHESSRVRNFVSFLDQANQTPPHTAERSKLLDMAGHLMYASHVSYTRDALLGADQADVLVDLVRSHERAGLYGAKITGGGLGGTVAVLANIGDKADAGIAEICRLYQEKTGKKPELLAGTSEGAWTVGTQVV